MADYWFYIPISEQLDKHLDPELPLSVQRAKLEKAIHDALDDEGWPRDARGEVSVPAPYYYVVLFKHGELRGHVGPITSPDAANRCARSWSEGGMRTKIRRQPLGPCLTNAGVQARDVYYP